MTLPQADWNLLLQAQQHCDQLAAQVQTLQTMIATVKEVQALVHQLGSFYEKDWLRIHDHADLTEDNKTALIAYSSGITYSVLGEDTIWNVLHEADQTQRQLIKALVKSL